MERLPKETPYWVKSYLNGVYEALTGEYHRNDLEFCYLVGNNLVSLRRESERYYLDADITPREMCDCPGGFYWRDTLFPFFTQPL